MNPRLAALSFLTLALSARAGDAPDEASSVALAERIQEAVAESGEAMDAAINVKEMVDKAVEGEQFDEEVREGFLQGVAQVSLGTQLAAAVEAGARYTFLRHREKDGRATLLFRLNLPNGSVNYHEYFLVKEGDGAKVSDLYVYLTGETIVRSLRRNFVKAAVVAAKGPADLRGWEKDWADNLDKFTAMTDASQSGKYKKALKLYKDLPESMRTDRTIMITRLTAAQQVGETEYQEALDDWEKLFPGDPSLDLLMIDSLYAKGRLDDLIKVLSRLSDRLGGDAWSDYLAGSVRLQQEKFAEARQAADKCIEAEPGLREGRFLILAVSLKQQDHALTAKTLTVLADEFGVPVGDLSAEPGYEEFVKSKEYEAWKASREK